MKLGFIGLGNMGRAICSGLIHGGAIAAQNVFVDASSDPESMCARARRRCAKRRIR